MLSILRMGGLTTGGVNFDAKVRRESFEPIDLFYAHIGGMDTFAHGLKIAHAILADGRLADFVKERYRSWDCGSAVGSRRDRLASPTLKRLSSPRARLRRTSVVARRCSRT